MNKSRLRIPTLDQYAFIEVDFEGTPEETVQAYNEYSILARQQGGLSPKDWNKALDRYLNKGDIDTEAYTSMSKAQVYVIQEIKRSLKRQNYNQENHESN